MLFVHVTTISQSSHQEDFRDFIFAKLTRLLLEVPTIKTLKLWEIYNFLEMSPKFLSHDLRESMVTTSSSSYQLGTFPYQVHTYH